MEDSGVLVYDAVSVDECFRMLYRNMVHSYSWVRECKVNAKHGR